VLEDVVDMLIPAVAAMPGFGDILIVSIDKKGGVGLNNVENSADE